MKKYSIPARLSAGDDVIALTPNGDIVAGVITETGRAAPVHYVRLEGGHSFRLAERRLRRPVPEVDRLRDMLGEAEEVLRLAEVRVDEMEVAEQISLVRESIIKELEATEGG